MRYTEGYLADGAYLSIGIPDIPRRIAIFEDTDVGTAEEACEHAKHALNAYGPLVEALKDIAAGEGIYGMQAHEYKMTARQALKDIGEDTP